MTTDTRRRRPPSGPTDPTPPARSRTEPPHPRIRARRIEIQRDEGRRRRRRLLALTIGLGLVTAVAALTRTAALDVDRITVAGAGHTTAAQVLSAAGVERGEPMIDLDSGAVADKVRNLPWVADASVQRSWPGTVKVSITERRAVALVGTGPEEVVVDRTGRTLEPVGPPTAALPRIEGETPAAPGASLGPTARPALLLADALTPSLSRATVSIGADGDSLSMRLREGGIAVAIGPPVELPAKVVALSALLASAERTPPIETIDVRVPSSSVLTRASDGKPAGLDPETGGA